MKKKTKITDIIKTLEDAYTYRGLVRSEEIPFATPKNSRQVAVNSFNDAIILVEALNEGKEPDFDSSDVKYSIWWYMRSKAAGGPGFSYYDYYFGGSYSFVGARLTFVDYDTMVYAAKTFPEVFEPFMTFQEFTEVPKG